MDEQNEPNKSPQTNPAEPSAPAIVTPATPPPQNEAIPAPAAAVATPHTPTPHSEKPPESSLQTAVIRPKEAETTPEPKTPTTPQIVEQPKMAKPTPDKAKKARAAIQSKKREKLDRILAEVAARGSISNNEVETLLGVSDATASRYLVALQGEGSLKRIGNTGKAVRYEPAKNG